MKKSQILRTEYKDLIITIATTIDDCYSYTIEFPDGSQIWSRGILDYNTPIKVLSAAKTEIDEHHNVCSEPGCSKRTTIACIVPDTDEIEGYYCYDHAWRNGYCFGCGQFWGGVESFDFPGPHQVSGYCDNCQSDFEEDDYDDEEDYRY